MLGFNRSLTPNRRFNDSLDACMYIAYPQHGDLRFSGPRQAREPVAGLEPATEGSLQISGRIRYPLCHRRPNDSLEKPKSIFERAHKQTFLKTHLDLIPGNFPHNVFC
ncbi:hypothetical protein PoB_006798700 [Plakobranchus ocellatus]|uniref:Uncharacterized protein n=1 Tax=Plakobranchus ocellatus TaxID=259542 RepID=A0AAV4DBT8_9GAST|nr:hypothetical protein PoB_006798700 [Plakobranchus ocellatus]